jgi:predicted Ser/Thr protein kinase
MLGITQNMPLDLRHFVMKDDRLLLIDFSRAVVHRCNNVTLVYSIQRIWLNPGREDVQKMYKHKHKHDCGELMTVAKQKMRAASVPHRQ